ncbi:MAG TPA: hypothetical protein VG370_06655 [Chloroflexota bacterium]|nr:hypothetical protein [Chloroflexota bacterium]
MAHEETRTLPYRELVRRVLAHHRGRGELVDFWLMQGGAIVGHYRVRPSATVPWTDLLPTGISAERYRQTIQRLGPILFPDEGVTVKAIERGDDEVTITVERG